MDSASPSNARLNSCLIQWVNCINGGRVAMLPRIIVSVGIFKALDLKA